MQSAVRGAVRSPANQRAYDSRTGPGPAQSGECRKAGILGGAAHAKPRPASATNPGCDYTLVWIGHCPVTPFFGHNPQHGSSIPKPKSAVQCVAEAAGRSASRYSLRFRVAWVDRCGVAVAKRTSGSSPAGLYEQCRSGSAYNSAKLPRRAEYEESSDCPFGCVRDGRFRQRRDGPCEYYLLVHHHRCPSIGFGSTQAVGINNSSQIVGSSIVGGFVDTGGSFTTFDVVLLNSSVFHVQFTKSCEQSYDVNDCQLDGLGESYVHRTER